MLLSSSQICSVEEFSSVPCDGDFCKNGAICQPSEDWVKKNCLIPFQTEENLPRDCICSNSDRDSAIIDIFIHNDTPNILDLAKFRVENNGTVTDIACEAPVQDCSSIVVANLDRENGDTLCRIGLVLYPPGPNSTTQGGFPDKIAPKTSVFIRAYSGRFSASEDCGADINFKTNLLYRILNDPGSSVQIETGRFREGGCRNNKPKHHFDPFKLSDENTKVIARGSLSAIGKINGGATYSVKIIGGTNNNNNNNCPETCPTGFQCYKGQCVPQVQCTGSTGCNLDFYCNPNNVCVPGCTPKSYNCSPGKTCINGECTTPSNGSDKRLRNILIGVSVVVSVVIIIIGFGYFLKNI